MLRQLIVPTILVGSLLASCTPTVAPTPTATKAQAAAPTAAPAKAPDAAKPAAATPTPAPAATPTPRPATVKFGNVSSVGFGGAYLAVEKGYFKEENLAVEVIEFRTTAEVVAPLGTGQLDVAGLPLSVPLLTASDRGIELRVVAGASLNTQGFNNTWIVLRKDLADSGRVKTPADLKGMKVAIPSLGSLGEQTVQIMLEQAGLKPDDVEVIVLPFAEQAAAFGNKAIAASFSNEPNIARGVQEGFSVKWIPTTQFFGGKAQGSVIVFGSTLLKDQDLARRWMVAYLRGVRDYLKAFTARDGREAAVAALVKYTSTKDPKLYDIMEMTYLDPNGMPDRKSMEAQYRWFVEKGLYTGKKTFDDIMDLSYAEYAAQKLGKQ